MTHFCKRHDAFTRETWRIYARGLIYSHMGWLRLVGSLKLWVSVAEYSLFYRALLQKRPVIFAASIMRWLWLAGSFKLKVSLAEYSLFCRALLQKRPVIFAATIMGWLRLVGSFKLKVSLAEHSLFCRALLQKRPVIFCDTPQYTALPRAAARAACHMLYPWVHVYRVAKTHSIP